MLCNIQVVLCLSDNVIFLWSSMNNDVSKLGLIFFGIQRERLCIVQGASPCNFYKWIQIVDNWNVKGTLFIDDEMFGPFFCFSFVVFMCLWINWMNFGSFLLFSQQWWVLITSVITFSIQHAPAIIYGAFHVVMCMNFGLSFYHQILNYCTSHE